MSKIKERLLYKVRVQYMSRNKDDNEVKTEIKYFLLCNNAIKWLRNYSRKNNCVCAGQVSKNSTLLYTKL